jgi:hypothetical protein
LYNPVSPPPHVRYLCRGLVRELDFSVGFFCCFSPLPSRHFLLGCATHLSRTTALSLSLAPLGWVVGTLFIPGQGGADFESGESCYTRVDTLVEEMGNKKKKKKKKKKRKRDTEGAPPPWLAFLSLGRNLVFLSLSLSLSPPLCVCVCVCLCVPATLPFSTRDTRAVSPNSEARWGWLLGATVRREEPAKSEGTRWVWFLIFYFSFLCSCSLWVAKFLHTLLRCTVQ